MCRFSGSSAYVAGLFVGQHKGIFTSQILRLLLLLVAFCEALAPAVLYVPLSWSCPGEGLAILVRVRVVFLAASIQSRV